MISSLPFLVITLCKTLEGDNYLLMQHLALNEWPVALCKILNFPPWLAIFDGLGTAGEASDSHGTTVQCLCEVVLSDGVSPQSKNGVEVELKRKYIEAGNLKFYSVR